MIFFYSISILSRCERGWERKEEKPQNAPAMVTVLLRVCEATLRNCLCDYADDNIISVIIHQHRINVSLNNSRAPDCAPKYNSTAATSSTKIFIARISMRSNVIQLSICIQWKERDEEMTSTTVFMFIVLWSP